MKNVIKNTCIVILMLFLMGILTVPIDVSIWKEYFSLDSDYQQVLIMQKWLEDTMPMGSLKGKDAARWEKWGHITEHLDGVWDCRDRAEVAKHVFRRMGYKTRYKNHLTFVRNNGAIVGHMWVGVYKDGKFIKDVMKEKGA